MKLNKYSVNSLWMISDKLILLFSSFLWSVILARGLGIENFGNYNAIVTSVTLLMPIAAFGLNGYLSSVIIKYPRQQSSLVSNAFLIKFVSGAVCGIFSYAIIDSLGINEANTSSKLIVITLLLAQACQVYEVLCQSHLKSIIITKLRVVNTLAFVVIKIYAYNYGQLTLNLSLILYATEMLIFNFMSYFSSGRLRDKNAKIKLRYNKRFLGSGGVLIASGFAEVINLKLDVLMLRFFSGAEAVSIYSVATKFSESTFFIANVIAASYLPKIIDSYKESLECYYNDLRFLKTKLLKISLVISLFLSVFSYPLISFMYGELYLDSYYVLLIHLISSSFVFIRAVLSKWIITSNLLKYSLITHALGAFVNVILNLILIPPFGFYGAALASLVSYSVSSHFSLLLFDETRVYLRRTAFIKRVN